jgi:curved DNA-binding protein CbpA
MSGKAAAPDLQTLLDAYALLEVQLHATPGDVRQSYRRLARANHPDRFPAASPQQRDATTRMTHLNAAYALIRDAPLRYHPISRGTETVIDDSVDAIGASLRRARVERRYRDIAAAVAFTVMAAIGTLILSQALKTGGFGAGAAVAVFLTFAVVICVRRPIDPLMAADALQAVLRLIATR